MEINKFKKLLEKERITLLASLKEVGVKRKKEDGDWEPKFPDFEGMAADKSEMADEVEEFDARIEVESELEDRLNEIDRALGRIQEGGYGKCIKGDDIEEQRLFANPAAETCIKHKNA